MNYGTVFFLKYDVESCSFPLPHLPLLTCRCSPQQTRHLLRALWRSVAPPEERWRLTRRWEQDLFRRIHQAMVEDPLKFWLKFQVAKNCESSKLGTSHSSFHKTGLTRVDKATAKSFGGLGYPGSSSPAARCREPCPKWQSSTTPRGRRRHRSWRSWGWDFTKVYGPQTTDLFWFATQTVPFFTVLLIYFLWGLWGLRSRIDAN